jgi:3',5'-cyclic-AMP phosphodiesterase
MSQHLEHSRITRRRFLNVSLAAAGGVVALGAHRSSAGQEKKQARWAFLSDTHVAGDPQNNYRGHYPYRNLHATFGQIAEDLPEGLIVTGDVARLTGQMEDYENFKKLMIPLVGRRPIYVALGNHDDRDAFLDVFEGAAAPKPPVRGKHIVTVDAGPARFVLLDSLLKVNETPGFLGKAQRDWLQSYLRTGDNKPVILFFHHSLRDTDGDLLDSPRLFDLIKPISKVKALVFGHSHEYAFSDLDGIHLINLPAVGYNFGDSQPVGWVEAQFTDRGGTFVLHAVGGNRSMDGRTERLPWRS